MGGVKEHQEHFDLHATSSNDVKIGSTKGSRPPSLFFGSRDDRHSLFSFRPDFIRNIYMLMGREAERKEMRVIGMFQRNNRTFVLTSYGKRVGVCLERKSVFMISESNWARERSVTKWAGETSNKKPWGESVDCVCLRVIWCKRTFRAIVLDGCSNMEMGSGGDSSDRVTYSLPSVCEVLPLETVEVVKQASGPGCNNLILRQRQNRTFHQVSKVGREL